MPTSNNWREDAERILDKFERGLVKEKLIQTTLASALGVSRQTIWRDSNLRKRIKQIEENQKTINNKPARRANIEMTNRQLRAEIDRLKRENSLLVQNIILICKNLQAEGLDPRKFSLEIASDIEKAYFSAFGSVTIKT